jgi:hypothetical protein
MRSMNWLRKIHGRRVPPGKEVQILRRLPLITLSGTLLKHIRSVDIFAIATEITLLTAVFTVAIGCVIVHIMKGPAYVADELPVAHSDRPKPEKPPL